MVTLHEVITFLVSMQISISSLQTHNVNRCGRSRHLARKLSLRRKRSRSEERFSRNAETDLVCRLLLEKKKKRERKERSTGDTAESFPFTAFLIWDSWLLRVELARHRRRTHVRTVVP